MRRRRAARGRRYAALVAAGCGGLLAATALAACGSEPATMVDAPLMPATGVTAPAALPPQPQPPGFAVAGTGGTLGATLEVSAVAGATAPAPAGGLRVVPALIPFPASRQAEMADYSLRHSGSRTAQLTPSVIVLHYTAGGTWSSTRSSFASDEPNLGELPNVCAHDVVDQDGTVYQLVPTTLRCRHTIGLNDVAIGIEMVQAAGSGPAWADAQILDRPAQVGAALALVRGLQAQYGISTSNVIGHAMANAAPQFHDLLGWRNDHVDWPAADVAVFRSRL